MLFAPTALRQPRAILRHLLLSLQFLTITVAKLVLVVTVFSAAGLEGPVALAAISMTLVSWAVGSILQAHPRTGSGYLTLSTSTYVYLGPALMAAHLGGISLVCGMTILAGCFQVLLSKLLRRFPGTMSSGVTAPVLLLLGLKVGWFGVVLLISSAVGPSSYLVGLVTLATALYFGLSSRSHLRAYAVLIAVFVGVALAAALTIPASHQTLPTPWLAIPEVTFHGLSWNLKLLLPFLAAALVATVKTSGVIAIAQQAESATPKGEDFVAGNRADGMATIIAGLLGSVGQGVNGTATAIAVQGKITSRSVAYSCAGLTLTLALCPRIVAFFLAIPEPVEGAILCFASLSILRCGMETLERSNLRAECLTLLAGVVMLGLKFNSLGLAVLMAAALNKLRHYLEALPAPTLDMRRFLAPMAIETGALNSTHFRNSGSRPAR